VAQIARTVARALGANEDLVEAIVLAHDLGHTPFGHSGERVLNRLLREQGGFEHNHQSLRVVDFLEVRSDQYRGLNLSYETRAGLLKHGTNFPNYPHPVPLPELYGWPSIEAQIANASDEIAYRTHDVDDGLRSNLLEWDQLSELKLWRLGVERATKNGSKEGRRLRLQAIVGMIDMLASDLIEATSARIREFGITSLDDVHHASQRMVGFSEQMIPAADELAGFLEDWMYRHYRVVRMALKAERILQDLWQAYLEDPRQLPPQLLEGRREEPQARVIGDYLAGMTDRFAVEEHRKLFDPRAHV
jgi:dGTPase